MPVKGQVVVNPINGDTHEYIETSKDTNGERVVALQDETFETISRDCIN